MRTIFTYFIQAEWGGPLKIGIAVNPFARLNELQIGNPYRLRIVGLIEGNREAELHDLFHDYRMQGEWFDAVRPFVDALKAELAKHVGDRFRSNDYFCHRLKLKGWRPDIAPLAGKSYRKVTRSEGRKRWARLNAVHPASMHPGVEC